MQPLTTGRGRRPNTNARTLPTTATRALAFTGVYAAGTWVGHVLVVDPGHIVLLWPPIGLLLGVLLSRPRGEWPIFFALAFSTTVALNILWRQQPVAGAVGLATATVVEAAVAASLMRRHFGDRLRFDRVRDVAGLLVICVLIAAPLAALIGATAAFLYLEGDFWREVGCWWLGDILGIVLLTPPLVAVSRAYDDDDLPRLRTDRILELIVCLGAISLVAALIYGSTSQVGIPSAILLPLLTWAAARFGLTGMSLALLAVTVIAAHLTAAGFGPSANLQSSVGRALSVQTVMISFGTTGWVLATLWRELRQALTDLRIANVYLEDTVTERTASLAASERKFRSVFEHAATGIALTELNGTFVQCNPAFAAMLGATATELRAASLVDALHPDDRQSMGELMRALVGGSTPSFAVESRFVNRSGASVSVDAFVSLLRDKDHAPTHVLALVSDITERKRIEDDLREADRRKDEFIAMLAHELRNPLAPIRTAAGVLRSRPTSDVVAIRCREILDRQVTHVSRLLDDLLDISRLSRGRLSLQRARVSLASILDAAMETVRPLTETLGHRVTVDGADREVFVYADSARLTQVFANLLDNAAKYTPASGIIRLTIGTLPHHVVVAVEDSGIGIAPEMLDAIFEMFVQGRQGMSPSSSGLGLGLALVRRLVDMHGGTIVASSGGLGRGSVFTVSLPLPESGATRPEVAEHHSPSIRR